MSEIRRHYFLNEYSIIAKERRSRPTDFRRMVDKEVSEVHPCYFCPENEYKTPPATAVYMKDGNILRDGEGEKDRVKGWVVRCFPNKFPALTPEPPPPLCMKWRRLGCMDGYGYHEIIVESPRHIMGFAQFTEDEITLVMKVYKDRVSHYLSDPKIKYVSLFKNCGKSAGASLYHTHTQLIALPIMPPKIEAEERCMKRECPMCDILENESEDRIIDENENFMILSPYCARFPFESWIIPKRHVKDILSLTEKELTELGLAILRFIRAMNKMVGDFPYNLVFYQHPHSEHYHTSVRIFPKLSTPAGFELNTDIFINVMPPEDACSYVKRFLDKN